MGIGVPLFVHLFCRSNVGWLVLVVMAGVPHCVAGASPESAFAFLVTLETMELELKVLAL